MARSFINSKVKDKWAICLECKKQKHIVSRGLCMGCWRTPGVRDKYKDKRLATRNPLTPCQLEIVNNPNMTEPSKLFFLAWRKVKRYGERIQVDDLKQIGWLMMLKGVKDFNPAWSNHTTLFRFCKRGISSEMERHCHNELRSATMGATYEDFVDFIANDVIDKQRGGTGKFKREMFIEVSKHALQRYRERVSVSGTIKNVIEAVRRSTPVSEVMFDRLTDRAKQDNRATEIREHKGVYYYLKTVHLLSTVTTAVITVLDSETERKDWERRQETLRIRKLKEKWKQQ